MMDDLFSSAPPPSPLSEREKLDWLRLFRSENVGPVTFRRLLARFGSVEAALKALPDLARRGGRSKPIKVCSLAAAEAELKTAQRLGARLLCWAEPAYPRPLAAIEDAPPCLYVLGSADLLNRPTIALVGARNASAGARQFARLLARELGEAGLVVASGLARGLDTAAHEGSLDTGTVAVVAGGFDVVYPPENDRLHAAIAAQGAIVSEMPPGTQPQARHFPRRNRIISGLAVGVVVVEATARSGSLITARMAGDQGREVFAVPGSPLDPRAEGPNGLIRDGATLVRHARDVLEGVAQALRQPFAEPGYNAGGPRFSAPLPAVTEEQTLETGRRLVEEALSFTPVMVDEIIRQCDLSPSVVSVILLELELAGRLDYHPGGRVSWLMDG